MLLALSAMAFLVLMVGRAAVWAIAMSPTASEIGTLPVDLVRCGPPGWRGIPDEEHPIPVVQLWYPTHAPAPARLPVLLYFSGWPGTSVDNPTLIRALAARGFVIASVIYSARPAGLDPAAYQRQRDELIRPMSFVSERAFQETLRRADLRVRARAEDAVSVLDMLTRFPVCEPANPLRDRLTIDRVGIFGFSLGGAVAAQAARLDRRFRAAMNMDGWHFADAAKYGVNRPYLWMSDDTPLPGPAELAASNLETRYTAILNHEEHRAAMANIRRLGGIVATITGTSHADFSDETLSSLRRRLSFWRISPQRVQQIIADYAAAFFEAALAGRPLTNAAGLPAYPEVRLEIALSPHSAESTITSMAPAPSGGLDASR